MDALVRAALARWPNVPDCYGWLALDGRGRWRLGEKRETITHAPMIDFIGRNYQSDGAGHWFFQNGPQKVFVTLDWTPFVWRIHAAPSGWSLIDHVGGRASTPDEVSLVDGMRFVIRAGDRVGVVHDHDGALLLGQLRHPDSTPFSDEALAHWLEEAQEKGTPEAAALTWPSRKTLFPLALLTRSEMAPHFRFVGQPQPDR